MKTTAPCSITARRFLCRKIQASTPKKNRASLRTALPVGLNNKH